MEMAALIITSPGASQATYALPARPTTFDPGVQPGYDARMQRLKGYRATLRPCCALSVILAAVSCTQNIIPGQASSSTLPNPPPISDPNTSDPNTPPPVVYKWVQSWQSAMAWASASFNNQTLRIVTRTSLGGKSFRVRLSNEFNSSPLVIAAAHVAVALTQDAIDPNTDQVLTFAGQTQVTLPAGQDIYSDAAALTVESATKLAVSLYFGQSTGSIATHLNANATSYYANGDLTGNANLGASPTAYTEVAVVDAIDVEAPSNTRGVVAFGDSITDGVNSTMDAYTRWSDILNSRLLAARAADPNVPRVAISNAGNGGNQVLSTPSIASGFAEFGPCAISRIGTDAILRSGVTHIVFLEGINDIGFNETTQTADAIIAGYTQIINAAHQGHVKIYFGTLTPIRNSTGPAPTTGAGFGASGNYPYTEPLRESVNQWIRTTHLHDGYVDFEAAVCDPGSPQQWLADNCNGDQIHPTDGGYNLMAQAIPLTWFY